MQWSKQQGEAMDAVAKWWDDTSKPFFYLGGYAGTGKTTLAKHLAEGINNVQYAAYTGKAALQLHKTGLSNVSTIHSLIYKVVPPNPVLIAKLEKRVKETEGRPEQQSFIDELRKVKEPQFVINDESILYDTDLLVLDECSMVDDTIARDLLDFGVPILVLGDPGQLPPIKGEGYFTKDQPDYFLTEIHRQATDNPIIAASMFAREKGAIPNLQQEEVKFVYSRDEVRNNMLDSDKVIVGKNLTRQNVNRAFRLHYGYEGIYPNEGETLICLRNYHEFGLLNGMFVEVIHPSIDMWNFKLLTSFETETGVLHEERPIFSGIFDDYDTPKSSERIPYYIRKETFEFDFGYCITVHKSQGSQYDTVFLWDDGMFSWDLKMRKRWLYTAITRASKKFIYARKR